MENTKKELKSIYNRWIAAKNRYEMALSMNTDESHVTHYKKMYDVLSIELHKMLEIHGYKTRPQLETAINDLSGRKPALQVIKGGKD